MITAQHIPTILDLLESCGISRFNVRIWRDGCVMFYGAGMHPDEVEEARRVLVFYLRSIDTLA